MDETVSITGSGLAPNAPVTLEITLQCPSERLDFRSTNRFFASTDGTLDPGESVALPDLSDYDGVDGMGPLWSMRPIGDSELGLQTVDVSRELEFKARLWEGHADADRDKPALAEASFQRLFHPPNVRRIPLAESDLHGTVFLPDDIPAGGKLPLVVTIYGGIAKRGHLKEERAALYAARGFATLVIGFFGVGNLPLMYGDLSIDYFERVIDHVVNNFPEVDGGRIGIQGISKGGDITLACAAFLGDKIKACVLQNSCVFSAISNVSYGSKVVKGMDYDIELLTVR